MEVPVESMKFSCDENEARLRASSDEDLNRPFPLLPGVGGVPGGEGVARPNCR